MSVSNSLLADAISVQFRIMMHTCVVMARDRLVLGSEGGIGTFGFKVLVIF